LIQQLQDQRLLCRQLLLPKQNQFDQALLV